MKDPVGSKVMSHPIGTVTGMVLTDVITPEEACHLDDDELTQLIADQVRAIERAQATLHVLTLEHADRQLYRSTGHVNEQRSLAATGLDETLGNRLCREGRVLARHPHLRAAHAQGRIGSDRLRLLLQAARGATKTQFAVDEVELTDAVANAGSAREAKEILQAWTERHTADGTKPDRDGDRVDVAKLFDTLLAAVRLSGIDREAFENELDTLTDQIEKTDKTAGLERTRNQRRAAALALMARRSASLGDRPVTRPLLVMVMTHDQHLAHGGATLLETGAHVPHATVEHAACTGTWCRIVMDATGRVIDLGRDARCNSDDQRLARIIRDHTCVFPDCDVPASACDGHHDGIEWVDGGRTDLDQLASVCGGHHDLLHHRGWTLHHHPDGSWTATGPQQQTLHRPPQPHTQPRLF
jgi:hypothetical protein